MENISVITQLVEALEGLNDMFGCCAICGDAPHNCELDPKDQLVQRQARRALDRARAEPDCYCQANECGPECPCYEAGLEAQREPAGRGTV